MRRSCSRSYGASATSRSVACSSMRACASRRRVDSPAATSRSSRASCTSAANSHRSSREKRRGSSRRSRRGASARCRSCPDYKRRSRRSTRARTTPGSCSTRDGVRRSRGTTPGGRSGNATDDGDGALGGACPRGRLLSGYERRGKDKRPPASMLLQIGAFGLLAFEDLTTVRSQPGLLVIAVGSQLRRERGCWPCGPPDRAGGPGMARHGGSGCVPHHNVPLLER